MELAIARTCRTWSVIERADMGVPQCQLRRRIRVSATALDRRAALL